MSKASGNSSDLVIYSSEDGKITVEVRIEDENVWLTQQLMAELFQTTSQNMTMHIRSIYEEGELQESATCKDFLQVRNEGNRSVKRTTDVLPPKRIKDRSHD